MINEEIRDKEVRVIDTDGTMLGVMSIDEAMNLAGEKKLWKPVLVLACLIGISRLYLYVHYPTDVLGGALAGAISGYLGYRFIQAIFYRTKQEGGGPCPK